MGFLILLRAFLCQSSKANDLKTSIILFTCINNYENESFKIYKNINPVIEANLAFFDRYKDTITLLKKMDKLR